MLTFRPALSLSISEGSSFPLGASLLPDGSVNFAVTSQFARSVDLCLFTDKRHPEKETA